jgi:hypothetical protein
MVRLFMFSRCFEEISNGLLSEPSLPLDVTKDLFSSNSIEESNSPFSFWKKWRQVGEKTLESTHFCAP